MSRIITVTLNPALDLSCETARVVPNEKLRCSFPSVDPGGGGINVSRALAFLGGESTCIVALGGASGDEVARRLLEEGLHPERLAIRHETRQSLSVSETVSGDQFRFVLPGATWSPQDCETARNGIAEVARPDDLLVISGSQPPGVPAAFFLDLDRALAPKGVRMVLDTSGAALAAAASGDAPLDLLRMDGKEAEHAAGTDLPTMKDVADFAETLLARGAARGVAISKGAEGTVAVDATGRWHCRPPKVDVVSAVGAGDSFVAGLTLALARGDGLDAACASGVAAAAAAVTTPATRLCDRATYERFLTEVETAAI